MPQHQYFYAFWKIDFKLTQAEEIPLRRSLESLGRAIVGLCKEDKFQSVSFKTGAICSVLWTRSFLAKHDGYQNSLEYAAKHWGYTFLLIFSTVTDKWWRWWHFPASRPNSSPIYPSTRPVTPLAPPPPPTRIVRLHMISSSQPSFSRLVILRLGCTRNSRNCKNAAEQSITKCINMILVILFLDSRSILVDIDSITLSRAGGIDDVNVQDLPESSFKHLQG